jgi:hypothetical protein
MGDSMSSVTIAGDSSGSVLLQAPAVSGSTTINIAAQSGTLNVAGPAFSATISSGNQALTANTITKVTFNSKQFDTANCYDATTNYRFTPTAAGYYQINCSATMSDASNQTTNMLLLLYKNGSQYAYVRSLSVSGNYTFATFAYVVYMNGTTDYLEVYAESITNNGYVYGASSLSFFSGCLLRGA